jgi:hypothetical protein
MAASASPAAASACGSFPSARSTTACAARFAEGLALMLGVTRLVARGEGRAEPGEEEGDLRLIVACERVHVLEARNADKLTELESAQTRLHDLLRLESRHLGHVQALRVWNSVRTTPGQTTCNLTALSLSSSASRRMNMNKNAFVEA